MSASTKVFFLGDVALDEYYSAPYFPSIKEKILVHTLPAQMGGMIANAACVYASYGVSASFLAALNDGAVSRALCDGLQTAGLDTSHMVWDSTLPDSKTIIILAEGEHTVFIPTMGLERIDLPDATYQALCESDFLYSTFCELRPLRYRDLDVCGVLDNVKAHGCRLWCDLDVAELSDGDERLFAYVDTLFVNELGFSNLTRYSNGESVASWLFGKGVRTLVVTKAEQGCQICTASGESFAIPGIPVETVDVTGAGDTFCSSFLYARTKTDDLRCCAEFANFAAARAVTAMGPRAGAGGAEAVLDFMQAHGGDREKYMFLNK